MDVSMDSTNKDYISSVLESVKANSLASKISNIDGKILPRCYTTYQEPLKDAGLSKSNISNVKDKVDTIHKPSFASIVHEKPQKMIIKIKDMRNEVSVNGATVTIPMEAIESVNARFVNTLYGYFIGDRLAFPLVENYVKNTWAKSAYARVLIEIAADVELVKYLIIAIRVDNKKEHTFATIDIEYEWTPPKCASCCIFDHVKKKKTKTKKKSKKQVEGVRLNKPTLNLQYQRVDKGKSSKINNRVANKESTDKGLIQITTDNSFSALLEETDTNLKDKEQGNANYQTLVESLFVNDSNEDVDEYITMEETSKAVHKVVSNNQGASTPVEVPWCLLGDFNAPLFVEDTSMRSSSLGVTMREFKECVENMEVMDVQRTGLQYTWNQKLKGKDGILRKLDWVLANLKFLDVFMGAHAVFKPYRISDHSPVVLSIPSVVKVVKKLNGLKKPISKLMYDKGNLHANVVRLREKLDKSRVSRSRIDVVTDVYGNVHHSTEVAKGFINHYEIFLGQPEVKSAMFSMSNDKSPVPDDFMAAFFKDAWDIIGVDVIKAVKEFLTNGRLLKELNHTIIALISKVNGPARVTDYRPISCCNVLFKCISKIIANRLKDSLKRLISPNQSAFVPGRCISDNILLTQEIMHNYHLDRGFLRCAFKVDIQKAYDTVDWDYNMSKGKVKVAWDVVCLLKREGGLDIRRLDHFNKALMVSHVWKLLALKESLWVKWIHVYKLKNRSFWDIPYRERLLCGLTNGVLRVLYPTSFHHETLLDLVLTILPRDGISKPFSVHNVWDSIRPRDNPVTWCDLVWFHACIPRHAFNMWLILKQRLRTQDCLRSWEVNSNLVITGLTRTGPSLASIITHLLPIAKRKSSKSCIGKLVVVAATYFIWHERNSRLFNKRKRSVTEVVDCILSNVRLKLPSCRFKKSRDAIMFARLWEIPISNLK
nr:hypothetical protein [Tanacetum cinerariifolium]